jgi:hypothetical protein
MPIINPDWVPPIEATFTDEKPVRSEQGLMLAGNPIAMAMGKPGAPYIAAEWHPFNGAAHGDGLDGLIYDHTADGGVSQISLGAVLPGYEYRWMFEKVTGPVGGRSMRFQAQIAGTWRQLSGVVIGSVSGGTFSELVSGHIDFLEKSGFKVFDDIWTVSGSSLTSISRVFSPANVEPVFKETRGIVSGSSAYWDLFRSAGYDSASIAASDYFYRGLVPSHTYFYPELGSIASPLAQGILEGEFRFELSWAPSPYETYLQEKRAFLSGGSSQPSVLYTHNKYPGHSQNSGECQPEDKTNFVRGLELANEEMVLDVAAIGSKLKDSIVVIAGDHGPYLTLNCTDLRDFDEGQIDKFAIQDRLSTFLAVSFPEGYQDYPKPRILQDIIPMILSVLSGGGENMFDALRRAADSTPGQFNGVSVIGGLIQGGPDNGEPLFDLD